MIDLEGLLMTLEGTQECEIYKLSKGKMVMSGTAEEILGSNGELDMVTIEKIELKIITSGVGESMALITISI